MRLQPLCVSTSVLAVLLGPAAVAKGDSLGCKRAAEVNAELRLGLAAGTLSPTQALARARELMQICPESAETFRIAACCAEVLGDRRAANWRSRAALNRAPTVTCSDLTPATAGASARDRTPEAPPGPVRRKFALLVGIGQFADPAIPRLTYPKKDAEDLARTLVDPRFGRFKAEDVRVLANAAATRTAVLDALQELILVAQPDDLVLLFISSHGSPNRPGAGLAGVGYILAHDTSAARIWRDGLEYRSFADKVALIQARRKVLFLDTCFSGQSAGAPPGAKALTLAGVGLSAATANMFLSGEGTYVVSSSRDDEQSWESDELRNGYFTHFLIEALQHAGTPTLGAVYEHVARNVPPAVARDKGAQQHPVMFPNNAQADLRIGVMPQLTGVVNETAPHAPIHSRAGGPAAGRPARDERRKTW